MMKKNSKMAVTDCIKAIDGSMARLGELTGHSQAFKAALDEWKTLSRALSQIGKGQTPAPKTKTVQTAKGTGTRTKTAKPSRQKTTAGKTAGVPKADKATRDAAVEPHSAELRLPRHTRLPASVRLTPHEIALNLGSFMTRELAQRDATELLSFARAIWNRSTVFPSPSRYGVQPHVEAAQPVKRSEKKFPSPWTVNVTIAIFGDDKKCAAWGENVYTRNRNEQE